jgi:2-iminobutanoate/2-iminopropanoate deaminase
MRMEKIFLPGVPAPAGHYSPGVIANGFVFVSGQLPAKPGTTEHVIGTIEEQTEQCLRNVEGVLKASGSSLDKVVQMTIYVANGDYWSNVNATYSKVMGAHKPARAVVPVKVLHFGYEIEIQAIALA